MNLFQRFVLASLPAALYAASAVAAPPLEVDQHFIHYSNCAEQTTLVTLPAVTLAGLLPAGFSFAPTEAGGQLAMVHVSGSTCSDDGDGKSVSDVLAFVEVIPPAELQEPGLGAYGIFLRGWVQNPKTAASFAAWGFGDLVSQATVSVTVKDLLGVRTGKTDASDARGGVSTRTTALGPEIAFAGARARLFHVKNGVVTAAIQGTYSPQKAKLGVGVMVQSGANFLPLPVNAAVVSHAWGYDLSVESVPVYGQ
ncbi:hypothetical protein DFR24_2572 [Panacagrimonas perspica]|uniref:Uncharacterized protein n=1 Tax=Panacagrimonas perspica TaxID=381431 RepID=A0A4S3K074_9GAMM|nr:hypothetical protein [Panacagrimonas perspica]TDU28207.1 hypothetical protein DFR24_2572 [Panacagrimonas perspica]THD01289.1 hypothetical protein B1810_20590 [Panacagrimonas perspica]